MKPHRFYREKIKQYPWIKPQLWKLSGWNVGLSILAIVFAFISKWTLDELFANNENGFMIGIVVLVTVVLMQTGMKTWYQYQLVKQQTVAYQTIQKNLFKSVLQTKYSIIHNHHTGFWMNILNSDVRNLSSGLMDVLPRFVFTSLRFVFAFALFLYLDPLMALMLTGLGVVILVVSWIFKNEMKRRYHVRQNEEAVVRGHLLERLKRVAVIKAFRKEEAVTTELGRQQDRLKQATLYHQRLAVGVGTSLQSVFMLVYLVVLGFGAWRISTGIITIGSLVAMLQLVEYMQSPFRFASSVLPVYSSMEGANERIEQVLSFEQETTNQDHTTSFTELVFDHVTFGYDTQTVLNDVSFVLKAKDALLLSGLSGVGKTTIFALLLGLYEPSSGTITIDGNVVNSTTRSYFAYVPQTMDLISGSIADNIRLYRDEYGIEDIHRVAKICGIHDDVIALSNGYDTLIGEDGYGLSVGQLQRLSIARAMLGDEPIVLLDEVTSALDATTESLLYQSIQSLTDKTLMIISHKPLPDGLANHTIKL